MADMIKYWILEGREPKEADLMTWAKWFETADKAIKKDKIGNVSISTVFLGINHNFGEGQPLIFETMIFGGKHDQYTERCATWDDAEIMHQTALQLVGAGEHNVYACEQVSVPITDTGE